MSSTLTTGGKNATDVFTRFIEGDDHTSASSASKGAPSSRMQPDDDKRDFWDSFAAVGEERAAAKEAARIKKAQIEPERKDFWDEFNDVGEQRMAAKQQPERKKGNIGTAAMRKPAGGGGGGAGGKDEWEDW